MQLWVDGLINLTYYPEAKYTNETWIDVDINIECIKYSNYWHLIPASNISRVLTTKLVLVHTNFI